MELVNFFDELISETKDLGNPVFARGDVVVMDNCGFHHNRFGERILRNLLDQLMVQLVSQPPYSPEYNVVECVFHSMRQRIREKPSFVSEFAELAVVCSLDIPVTHLQNYFQR